MNRMKMREFKKLVQQGDIGGVLVDVRTPEEFRAGHIPGAVNVPLDRILAGVTGPLEDKSEKTYVYCHSGVRSEEAGVTLEKMGYSDIIDLGGIISWRGQLDTSIV